MAKSTTKTNAPKTAKVTATEKVQKKGVTYTFGGDYYSKTDKGVIARKYELAVTFPDVLQAPLSVFKGAIDKTGHPINTLMIKAYPEFSRIRTYNILKVVNNTTNTKKTKDVIELMDLEQLKSYIADKDLGIDTAVYDDRVDLVRTAIKHAETDAETFATTYAKDVEDYKYRKEIEALNATGDNGENETPGENGEIDDLLDDLDGDNDDNEGDNGDDE